MSRSNLTFDRSQRQHLTAPEIFTAEVAAAVTVLNRLVPKRGLLAACYKSAASHR